MNLQGHKHSAQNKVHSPPPRFLLCRPRELASVLSSYSSHMWPQST